MEKITPELIAAIRANQHPRLSGDISGLRGYISSGLSGDISGLRGDISGLSGDISSGLSGDISSGLRGDISGLRGDISGLSGDISSGLSGDILAGKVPGLSYVVADAEEIARLDAVREVVLATPTRLRMVTWHSGSWSPEHTPEEEHSCKSAHCIAGWLQALSPDPEVRNMEAEEAGKLLAPASSWAFFTSDAFALQWLKDRRYAADGKQQAEAAT